MSDTNEVPEGYMKDGIGRLVPIERVSEIDKLKNQVASDLAQQAIAISKQLALFKRTALDDVRDLVQIAAEKYGSKIGGIKGNVSVVSYDGRYKITRTLSETVEFGLEVEAAKALFDEYIEHALDGAPAAAVELIKIAFRTKRDGKLRTSELLRLLSYEIDHPLWHKACAALRDSMTSSGVTVYIRVYERIKDSDKYRPVPLDICDMAGGY